MPDDVEDLIRRYRPVGPPPELRARVLGRTSAAGDWAWLAAAAALAIVTVMLRGTGGSPLPAYFAPREEPHAAIVRDLAASLDAEEHAYFLAETIVLQEQVRAANAATPEVPNR